MELSMDDNGDPGNTPRSAVAPPSTPFELRHASTARVLTVVVPDRRFLAIEGRGHPRAADYELATEILREVERTLRGRLPGGRIYGPAKAVLEVTWRLPLDASPEQAATSFADLEKRHWRQLIELPVAANDEDATAAIDATRRHAARSAPLVRIVRLAEGFSAQLLHVGGSDEALPILTLFRFAVDGGFVARGPVHQIVLTDIDLVPTGRTRSIFRLPIAAG
jgi:hypothetical protein